jgi:small-conductance mechanosensitive channel
MAMIECPECNTEVSDSALRCPKCAYQINKPKRGFFGKIFKWLFILFNILMILWIWGGVSQSTEAINADASGAVAVGTGIGISMLLVLWAIGDIILGLLVLFTKPKS